MRKENEKSRQARLADFFFFRIYSRNITRFKHKILDIHINPDFHNCDIGLPCLDEKLLILPDVNI